jgi:sec-independent protein translocase protein TatB
MFDIGFWELALIGLVVLLVVGPERLPKVARTAGLWIGRGRRVLSSVKAEIDREIKAQELKEILDKQAMSKPLETILDDSKRKPAESTSETPTTASQVKSLGKSESGPKE